MNMITIINENHRYFPFSSLSVLDLSFFFFPFWQFLFFYIALNCFFSSLTVCFNAQVFQRRLSPTITIMVIFFVGNRTKRLVHICIFSVSVESFFSLSFSLSRDPVDLFSRKNSTNSLSRFRSDDHHTPCVNKPNVLFPRVLLTM